MKALIFVFLIIVTTLVRAQQFETVKVTQGASVVSEASIQNALAAKQNALVSGTNIKTINGTSLLGSGNIAISGTGNPLDAYPVGSIYISVNSTNPSELFGGTWVAFGSGKMLVGIDPGQTEFDTPEETGGNKSVTLTTNQIPSHSHVIPDVRSATTGTANTLIARAADASSTAGNDVVTATAGGGQAVNILNPYISVYLFKRSQ